MIERARGFLEAATLSDEWVSKMQNKALLLEAHYTTHIEGTQLTLEQSEQLWAGEHLAAVNPDDTRELLNYRQAFDLVASYIGEGEPITEGLIREIHKRLVEGVRGNTAAPGDYRKIQNYQEVKLLGKQAIEQDVMIKKHRLSDRQKLAIKYISRHGGISIQQFENICPDMTRRTLQRELKELLDKDILCTTGATSNLLYEMSSKSKSDWAS